MTQSKQMTYRIVFVAVMAAIVYILTIFRIPFLGSYVHPANAMCILAGVLFGPYIGGLSAGLGSGIYDIIGGWGIISAILTFITKGAMGLVAGGIAHGGGAQGKNHKRNFIAGVAGALSYVVLYWLRKLIETMVGGVPFEGAVSAVVLAMPASLINAVFAFVVAPIFATALRPALSKSGALKVLAEKRASA